MLQLKTECRKPGADEADQTCLKKSPQKRQRRKKYANSRIGDKGKRVKRGSQNPQNLIWPKRWSTKPSLFMTTSEQKERQFLKPLEPAQRGREGTDKTDVQRGGRAKSTSLKRNQNMVSSNEQKPRLVTEASASAVKAAKTSFKGTNGKVEFDSLHPGRISRNQEKRRSRKQSRHEKKETKTIFPSVGPARGNGNLNNVAKNTLRGRTTN